MSRANVNKWKLLDSAIGTIKYLKPIEEWHKEAFICWRMFRWIKQKTHFPQQTLISTKWLNSCAMEQLKVMYKRLQGLKCRAAFHSEWPHSFYDRNRIYRNLTERKEIRILKQVWINPDGQSFTLLKNTLTSQGRTLRRNEFYSRATFLCA